jgi:hypothetical protein
VVYKRLYCVETEEGRKEAKDDDDNKDKNGEEKTRR